MLKFRKFLHLLKEELLLEAFSDEQIKHDITEIKSFYRGSGGPVAKAFINALRGIETGKIRGDQFWAKHWNKTGTSIGAGEYALFCIMSAELDPSTINTDTGTEQWEGPPNVPSVMGHFATGLKTVSPSPLGGSADLVFRINNKLYSTDQKGTNAKKIGSSTSTWAKGPKPILTNIANCAYNVLYVKDILTDEQSSELGIDYSVFSDNKWSSKITSTGTNPTIWKSILESYYNIPEGILELTAKVKDVKDVQDIEAFIVEESWEQYVTSSVVSDNIALAADNPSYHVTLKKISDRQLSLEEKVKLLKEHIEFEWNQYRIHKSKFSSTELDNIIGGYWKKFIILCCNNKFAGSDAVKQKQHNINEGFITKCDGSGITVLHYTPQKVMNIPNSIIVEGGRNNWVVVIGDSNLQVSDKFWSYMR